MDSEIMDKANAIYDAIYNQLELEIRPDGLFEGFKLYPDKPIREGVVFPCMMLIRENFSEDKNFFSGDGIRVLQLDIHLAFGSRNSFLREGDETFNAEDLIYNYISKLDEFYNKLEFPEELNIENALRQVEPIFPLNPKTEQYGCVYSIAIYFER